VHNRTHGILSETTGIKLSSINDEVTRAACLGTHGNVSSLLTTLRGLHGIKRNTILHRD